MVVLPHILEVEVLPHILEVEQSAFFTSFLHCLGLDKNESSDACFLRGTTKELVSPYFLLSPVCSVLSVLPVVFLDSMAKGG